MKGCYFSTMQNKGNNFFFNYMGIYMGIFLGGYDLLYYLCIKKNT